MINFTILTDTPARLRSFLISRDIMKLQDDGEGGQQLVGARPGMEIAEVPNPIVTVPGSGVLGEPGHVDPTYDTRRAFLVKFAHESEGEKAAAFRDWLMANSTVVTAPAEWTIQGEPVGDARKINGEQVWLVHDRPDRFGVWQ